MKFTYIGGATAILEHKGKRMLFDPWLDEGIYHGSWYHYPPPEIGIDQMGRFDYVYISHIHEDHCSPGTIQHINRDAEIILMENPQSPNYVTGFFKQYGFEFQKIHLIKPKQPIELELGLLVDFVTADPSHLYNYLIDSGLILKWDGFTIYNSNDCPPYDDGLKYILDNYQTLDLALLPYATGSSYPSCWNHLPKKDKFKEKERLFKSGIENFLEHVKTLKPKYFMPFADGYVVGGSRSFLNKYMPHPPGAGEVFEAVQSKSLQGQGLFLNSGQSFDFDSQEKMPEEDFRIFSEQDRDAYIETELKDKLYDHEKFQFSPSVSISRLMHYARGRMWKKQRNDNFFPKFTYYFDCPEKNMRYQVMMDKPDLIELEISDKLVSPFIRVSAPASLWIMMLIGHVSWNIADAALFLDYERIPDTYDPALQAYLNHMKL
jgi:UDP-MurNAc hydroxylase